MLIIEGDNINLTRSDDCDLVFNCRTSEGETYALGPEDKLIFCVRAQATEDSPVLIRVESAPGHNVIPLHSADTANLAVGRYSAECQLTLGGGARITVWPSLQGSGRYREGNYRNFIIMPEVVRE